MLIYVICEFLLILAPLGGPLSLSTKCGLDFKVLQFATYMS